MTSGEVYFLTNPSMPNLLKIGWTSKSVMKRIGELYTTGVPEPFQIEYYIAGSDARALEREIHTILASYRYRKNREFFKISTDDAIQLICQHLPNIVLTKADAEVTISNDNKSKIHAYYTDLSREVEAFEKIADARNWFLCDDNWESDISNRHMFDVSIKQRMQYITDGLAARPTAVSENSRYVDADDNYVLDELRHISRKLSMMRQRLAARPVMW